MTACNEFVILSISKWDFKGNKDQQPSRSFTFVFYEFLRVSYSGICAEQVADFAQKDAGLCTPFKDLSELAAIFFKTLSEIFYGFARFLRTKTIFDFRGLVRRFIYVCIIFC